MGSIKYVHCLVFESQSDEVKKAISEIGGIWLALQRYNEIHKPVGPFKISLREALDNEIIERFETSSYLDVFNYVTNTYKRSGLA